MSVWMTCSGRGSAFESAAVDMQRYAQRMLRALAMQDAELSLLLCGDQRMRGFNRAHRGIDRTTDVLAFAMNEGKRLVSPRTILGDIVISLPTAARQAREHGWPVHVEVCLLLAHGLMHLLGHDHRDRTEERRMMARTHLLMTAALPRPRRVDKRAGRPRRSGAARAMRAAVRT
jgi:probable rRNA maturation factor